MKEKRKAVKEEQQKVIREGGEWEVNQWLKRAEWDKYLVDVEVMKLLNCVTVPDEETEHELYMIWQGMNHMVQKCQETVVSQAGLFIRFEASHTEKHQTQYASLKGYMNRKAVIEHAWPWKQILMFIRRTQGAQEWKKLKYKLKKEQKKAWKHLWRVTGDEYMWIQGLVTNDSADEAEESLTDDLSQACLNFCFSLLQEQYSKNEYSNVLVCGLAVLRVQKSGAQWGWMDPGNYSPVLFNMIKIAQFMVIEQAFQQCEQDMNKSSSDDSCRFSESGNSSEFSHIEASECLKLVKKYMNKFMVHETHGVMQWMLDLRTYGLKIHFNITAEGSIDWVEEQISWKGQVQFTMNQLREMVQGMIQEAWEILFYDLMLVKSETEISVISWSALWDNSCNEEVSWNYLQDERNLWLQDGQVWLQDHIRANLALQSQFLKDESASEWDQKKIYKYLNDVIQFQGILLILMHICGEQPAWGPEIIIIQHSNGVKGHHRNIFIEQNTSFSEDQMRLNPEALVVFITQYHKGYSVTGKEKIIHRYLPWMMRELYMYFDWLMQPFQWGLNVFLRDDQVLSVLIWSVNHWGKIWDTSRMSQVMKHFSQKWMRVQMTLQSYCEIVIVISRQDLQKIHAFDYDEDDEEDAFHADWPEEIHDLQAGHVSWIAGNIYSQGIMKMSEVVASMHERFYHVSRKWHQWLGLDADQLSSKVSMKRKSVTAATGNTGLSAFMVRVKRLRRMDIVSWLKAMLRAEAEFWGCQQEVIQSIMREENCVVQVMSTGGGKSLSFMLPAWCSISEISVVIVPLIALWADMMNRCQWFQISCAEWNSQQLQNCDEVRLVLIISESAVEDAFQLWLHQKKEAQQLNQIYVDECHVILNNCTDFCCKLQQLKELSHAEAQMILLTATLPLSCESELWRRMRWNSLQVRMFWALISQVNIRYCTIWVKGQGKVISQYAAVITEVFTKYSSDKAVIYCNAVNETIELAAELSCRAFHHDASDKSNILQWFRSDGSMLVAMSAFSMSIDIADIRLIIHISWSCTLLDYAQESDQTGWDELNSEAVMIICSFKFTDTEDKGNDQLIRSFMTSIQCKWIILNGYLNDRVNWVECEDEEKECEVCMKARAVIMSVEAVTEVEQALIWQESKEITVAENDDGEKEERDDESSEEERIAEFSEEDSIDEDILGLKAAGLKRQVIVQAQVRIIQDEAQEVETLHKYLTEIRETCPFCWWKLRVQWLHNLYRCRERDESIARNWYKILQGMIHQLRVMIKYSECTECFLPVKWCDWFEGKGTGSQGGVKQEWVQLSGKGLCQFDETVLSEYVVAVESDEEFMVSMREWMRSSGYEWGWDADQVQYFEQRKEWGGIEANQLLQELSRFHQLYS